MRTASKQHVDMRRQPCFFSNWVEIECKGLKTTERLPSHTPTQGESEEGGGLCRWNWALLPSSGTKVSLHYTSTTFNTIDLALKNKLLTFDKQKQHILMLHYIKKVDICFPSLLLLPYAQVALMSYYRNTSVCLTDREWASTACSPSITAALISKSSVNVFPFLIPTTNHA